MEGRSSMEFRALNTEKALVAAKKKRFPRWIRVNWKCSGPCSPSPRSEGRPVRNPATRAPPRTYYAAQLLSARATAVRNAAAHVAPRSFFAVQLLAARADAVRTAAARKKVRERARAAAVRTVAARSASRKFSAARLLAARAASVRNIAACAALSIGPSAF
jgi:hypothetical protein